MKTLLAIDHDRWACETYRANFPGVEVRQSEITGNDLPYADVILGGPPCQGFSLAGEGKGEHDERDGWPAFCTAVEKGQPRQFLAENVAGMLTERHIKYFGRVLARLEEAGYAVQWRLLDAVNYGVPQFRERVFVWGIRKDLYEAGARHRWPERTHVWPPPDVCMFGSELLPGVTVGQALGIVSAEYEAHGRREAGPVNVDAPGPTMRSGSLPGCSDILVHKIIGGGQNPHYAGEERRERDITDEPSTTIASQHTHNALPAVHEYRWSDAMLDKHPPASPASPASPAPTVQAKWFKGGAEGLLTIHKPRSKKVIRRDHAFTEPCPTVEARAALGGGSCLAIRRDGLHVRRLTPLECLRLQSGPDSFLWPSGITKTAMYRIVGNGWASALAAKLSAALKSVDPESCTVIDLFCGGGLGAVGWHGRFWSYESNEAVPHSQAREDVSASERGGAVFVEEEKC